VSVNKDDTAIVEGAGKKEAIQGRIKAIKSQINHLSRYPHKLTSSGSSAVLVEPPCEAATMIAFTRGGPDIPPDTSP
jgi:hypothetical protein